MPISQPPGIILNCRLGPWLHNIDGVSRISEALQKRSCESSGGKVFAFADLLQIRKIGLDPKNLRLPERCTKLLDRFAPICSMHDHLRQHRVVKRRDLGSRVHPRLNACALWPANMHQAARTRLKVPSGILRVNAHLDGRSLRLDLETLKRRHVASRES